MRVVSKLLTDEQLADIHGCHDNDDHFVITWAEWYQTIHRHRALLLSHAHAMSNELVESCNGLHAVEIRLTSRIKELEAELETAWTELRQRRSLK